ncbi:MAG TPA: GC-type dockerin domain-anchored protein [Phycisphaerales bacterium]|nr:GC-type dockerin domain-anchored protein [Phycisphaerales bacterium]
MERRLESLVGSAALAIVAAAGSAGDVRMEPRLTHAIEFRASTYSASAQEEPALSVAPDGSFAVVWSSRRQQQGRYGVYVQRFDARGVAIGTETPVNVWTRSHASAPVMDFAPDGAAWAAWQSSGQDGWGSAVVARRFSSSFDGSSEILVNERVEGEQSAPVVAALPDGGAVVAWSTSSPGPAGAQRVAFRVLNADGTARTPELDPGQQAGERLETPSVAARADGSFALAWSAFSADEHRPLGVRVRLFAPDGSPLAGESAATAPGAITPVEPVIAAAGDGFVIAWHDVLESELGYDVLAARLDPAGALASEPVVVNTRRTGLQNAAAIAVAPSGALSIAFNARDESGTGVYVREFDASLRPLGPESALTGRVEGEQAMRETHGGRRLAYSPEGALLCAWRGDAGFGDSSGANVTLHSPTPLDLGRSAAGVTPDMPPALASTGVAMAGAEGPQPHEPPTFDPREIDLAEREIVRTRGGTIGFTGILNTGWTPPDPHMAVGPEHVVVMTNGAIAFFTKDGAKTFQDEIEDSFGFWGPVGATGFVFDPEVVYDHTTGRFFAMAAEAFAPGGKSYCLVAVSDDSDPNGSWFRYRFDTSATSGDLFDSPNIGVTDSAVVITGDGFGLGARYPVYVFDKASMLVGNPPAIAKSFLLSTSTQSAGFPRVTSGTGDTLYLVEHKEAASNNTSVRVLAFTDLLTSPTVSEFTLAVPAYGAPEDPPQMGTSGRPEAFDARFWSVDQGAPGALWATHHINQNRVVARWYEIALNGWPFTDQDPALVQSGDIDLGADVRTYFSSINAGDDGTVAMSFARSSPTEFISAASAYRSPCTPAGLFTADFIHKSSNAGYNAGRWGDYSAVQFDPAAPTVYWTHHEYAEAGSWRTWVQSVESFDRCLQADINNDGIVNTMDLLEFLNQWNAGDCLGDWRRDGALNTLDVLAYLNDFAACR